MMKFLTAGFLALGIAWTSAWAASKPALYDDDPDAIVPLTAEQGKEVPHPGTVPVAAVQNDLTDEVPVGDVDFDFSRRYSRTLGSDPDMVEPDDSSSEEQSRMDWGALPQEEIRISPDTPEPGYDFDDPVGESLLPEYGDVETANEQEVLDFDREPDLVEEDLALHGEQDDVFPGEFDSDDEFMTAEEQLPDLEAEPVLDELDFDWGTDIDGGDAAMPDELDDSSLEDLGDWFDAEPDEGQLDSEEAGDLFLFLDEPEGETADAPPEPEYGEPVGGAEGLAEVDLAEEDDLFDFLAGDGDLPPMDEMDQASPGTGEASAATEDTEEDNFDFDFDFDDLFGD